jgi:hypothetical protein
MRKEKKRLGSYLFIHLYIYFINFLIFIFWQDFNLFLFGGLIYINLACNRNSQYVFTPFGLVFT